MTSLQSQDVCLEILAKTAQAHDQCTKIVQILTKTPNNAS